MAGSRKFQVLVAAALGALAAGCQQSADPGAQVRASVPDAATTAPAKPRVVVAVIDSGINPYHEFFNASDANSHSPAYPPGSHPSAVTREVLDEFGIRPDHIVRLHRTGNPAVDVAADSEAVWKHIKPNEPYWFEGTNIIAVGRHGPDLAGNPDPGPLILPKDDSDTHGVGVVASLLLANPEAIVFFVQHNNDETSADMGSQEAHEIAFFHPAVDIVSTSYVRAVQPEVKAFYSTFDAVVHLGKLHVAAAFDPGPAPTFTTGSSGPWWSIGISGFDEDYSNGRFFSGSFPDFISLDYVIVPACAICETGLATDKSGNSLAAPRAAGVISRVLLEARRTFAHAGGIRTSGGVPVMVQTPYGGITNWQIRRAMEQAAYVPTTAEYNPTGGAKSLPIQDAAPWAQIGWGVLSPNPTRRVVEEALGFLGIGAPTREKAPGFCDFQTKLIQERHEYWDNVSPLADSVIPDYVAGNDLDTGGDAAQQLDTDPFIYCGSTAPSP